MTLKDSRCLLNAVDLPPLGIAIAAAYGVGAIKTFDEAIAKIPTTASFTPNADNYDYYSDMYKVFRNLYTNLVEEFDALAEIDKKYGKKRS